MLDCLGKQDTLFDKIFASRSVASVIRWTLVSFILICPNNVSAQPDKPILVVPFTNLNPTSTDGWIGTGIADSIAVDLRGLGVATLANSVFSSALSSMDTGANNRFDLAMIAVSEAAGAHLVVGGSYQRVGDRIHITTRIIAVETATVDQIFKFEGPFSDLFRLQDAIVDALAEILMQEGRPEASGEPLPLPES
ncbi:MAG: hypothetical protein CL484_11320, partial [Acidobacteria bacterium]|nr:hypothetical protein [Acidobacteriota bacterium]